MEGIQPFLASWWMLEEPATGGHEAGKLGRGKVHGKEAITSSTSATQRLNSLSVFKQAEFAHTQPTQLTVF